MRKMRPWVPWVGVTGMFVPLWFCGFIALVAPWWVVPIAFVVWVVMFVLCLMWFNRRPWWVFAMPFIAMVLWFGTVAAGGAWLGWTA